MAWIGPNHSFVVWAACFLWLTSIFEIIWALLLFFCVGDILLLTGTDLVNAFVLLSGVIMLPTNLHMLYSVAHGRNINHKETIICCPLWICILCVIVINVTGAVLCVNRITAGSQFTYETIKRCMDGYRDEVETKRVIDKLQWSLKCCGLNSYEDWFSCDWYDNISDLEDDWSASYRLRREGKSTTIISTTITSYSDSVPFSCCKSGFCVAQFLSELGVGSINTTGCGKLLHRIVLFSMSTHFLMFLSVIFVEALLLRFVIKSEKVYEHEPVLRSSVEGIMSINEHFVHSSTSHVTNSDDSRTRRGLHANAEVLNQVMKDIFNCRDPMITEQSIPKIERASRL